jgi:hypothetical protein
VEVGVVRVLVLELLEAVEAVVAARAAIPRRRLQEPQIEAVVVVVVAGRSQDNLAVPVS